MLYPESIELVDIYDDSMNRITITTPDELIGNWGEYKLQSFNICEVHFGRPSEETICTVLEIVIK